MGLLAKRNATRTGGSLKFEGHEIAATRRPTLRELWGAQMAMVFQDPMTSLDPVMKSGSGIHRVACVTTSTSAKTSRTKPRCQLLTIGRHPGAKRRLREYPTSCRVACATT